MTNRPFLFMSGESSVTLKATFRRDAWSHTCVAKRLVSDDKGLRREGVNETLKGVIYYADVEDKALEQHNLRLLRDENIPCWPDPGLLLSMGDRYTALRRAQQSDLIDHDVWMGPVSERDELIKMRRWWSGPLVMKTGTLHSGHGKHRIEHTSDIPMHWDGIASFEPFFDGVSYRVLVVGGRHLVIRIDNAENWVKNAPGADVSVVKAPDLAAVHYRMIGHALEVTDRFGLEVCGVDYVVEGDGYHFLEANWYPGVSVDDDEFTVHIERFLDEKMTHVEALHRARTAV